MYASPSGLLSKEENEKRLLRNALIQSHGNRTKKAQLMGISRRTLHRKLVKWPELDTPNTALQGAPVYITGTMH